MERRTFLKACTGTLACAAAGASEWNRAAAATQGDAMTERIMTVTGPVRPGALGCTLTHEHILVDFAGAQATRPESYDLDEAFDVVRPHLDRIAELGCRTLVECTPAYIGRSPRLLQRLARATGMRILTNTGYYGASKDKFLPAHAFEETAEQLAGRWIAEWEQGIAGSGIRPGFIKTAVDVGPLSAVDRKLVRAAALAHLGTGLTIMSHTGPAVPAFEQMAVLREEGVAPDAWIWTHAQNEKDEQALLRAAGQGAWVALDGVREDKIAFYVQRVLAFRGAGLLHRLLLSHDAGWYTPGEPGGGSFRAYDTLFTRLLPALREGGCTDAEIEGVTARNPAEAFTVRLRPVS
jgi:phosphotriesterase-related protein